jgi:heparin binding hemagglutinin HbhA
MPITTEVRKAREAVVDQSKAVLEDARKPLYAVVGAGDLAVSRTATSLRVLPTETQSAVDSQVKLARTRLEGLRAELLTRISDLRGKAAELPGKAKGLYEDLAVRGEKVVTKVSDRPGVKQVIDRAETLFDRAGESAQDAAAHLDEAAQTVTERKTTTRRTPARKTATK